MPTIWYYDWEESERGWGTRPDGLSLHGTEAGARAYLKAYWDRQPKGPAPEEYERTTSEEPRAIQAEPEEAAWVQAKDRRLWNRQAGVASRVLTILDAALKEEVRVEGSALLEAAQIDKAVNPAASQAKRPAL